MNNLDLKSCHILKNLDEKCTMDNPCIITTNSFGDILIEQDQPGIFTAIYADIIEPGPSASCAFLNIIPKIRASLNIEHDQMIRS